MQVQSARQADKRDMVMGRSASEILAREDQHRQQVIQMSQQIAKLEDRLNATTLSFSEVNMKLISIFAHEKVSDRIVAILYEDLCQSIENWVSLNCGRMEITAERLSSASFESECAEAQALFKDDSVRMMAIIGRDSGDVVLERFIMRFLFENLLRNTRWLPGLSREQETALQLAADNVMQAFPARGPEMREIFRCDMYTSLSKSSKLKAQVNVYLDHLSAQLSYAMMGLFNDKSRFNRRALETIINSAAALADTIRKCPSQFCLLYALASPSLATKGRINATMMNRFTFVDVETGNALQSDLMLDEARKAGDDSTPYVVLPSLVKILATGDVIDLAKGKAVVAQVKIDKPSREKEETHDETLDRQLLENVGHRAGSVEDIQPVLTSLPEAPRTWASVAAGKR